MNTSVIQSYKLYIKESWQTFKRNPLFILRVYIVVFVISSIFNFITKKVSVYHEQIPASSFFELVIALVGTYVNTLVWIGLTLVLIHLVRKERAEIKELFKHSKKVLKVFLASCLLVLGTIIGLCLLVVPGIIFFLTYQFAPFRLIEKDMSVKNAFEESAHMVQGKRWYLFGLYTMVLITWLIWMAFWSAILALLIISSVHMSIVVIAVVLAFAGFLVFLPMLNLFYIHVYDIFVQKTFSRIENPQTVADSLPLAR